MKSLCPGVERSMCDCMCVKNITDMYFGDVRVARSCLPHYPFTWDVLLRSLHVVFPECSYGNPALGCRFGRDNMPTLCSTYPIAKELSWIDFWHDSSKELDMVCPCFSGVQAQC